MVIVLQLIMLCSEIIWMRHSEVKNPVTTQIALCTIGESYKNNYIYTIQSLQCPTMHYLDSWLRNSLNYSCIIIMIYSTWVHLIIAHLILLCIGTQHMHAWSTDQFIPKVGLTRTGCYQSIESVKMCSNMWKMSGRGRCCWEFMTVTTTIMGCRQKILPV